MGASQVGWDIKSSGEASTGAAAVSARGCATYSLCPHWAHRNIEGIVRREIGAIDGDRSIPDHMSNRKGRETRIASGRSSRSACAAACSVIIEPVIGEEPTGGAFQADGNLV